MKPRLQKVFPGIKLTKADREYYAIGNYQILKAWLAGNPTVIELKKAILVELERENPSKSRKTDVLHKMVVALQRTERRELESRIETHLKNTRL